MTKIYRIKDKVKPYSGKLFHSKGEPDGHGYIWGYVKIDWRRFSSLKSYKASELTFVEEKAAA